MIKPTMIMVFALVLCVSDVGYGQFGAGGSGSAGTKIYDGKVSGVIIDSLTNQPVEFATVALINKENNKPINGCVTDDNGSFKIKNIKNGNYKISISFIGYRTHDIDSIDISDKKKNYFLGKIFFVPNVNQLKETTVEGEQSLIENKIDKIVFNADKDITTKGGNATDVLKKVPMVSVDLDGNVMLRGTTNIRVLINNKPSSIMAGSIADAMKMIPADNIEKVEVITNPSAKYDAEGTGGIINIITKKKLVEGLSGSVNASAGTRSSSLFGNINYKKGRVGVGGGFGGFMYRGNGNSEALRTNREGAFAGYLKQTGTNKNIGVGPSVSLNFDYDISSRNNLSFSSKLSNFYNNSNTDVSNFFSADNIEYTEIFRRKADNTIKNIGLDISLDYKRSFKNPAKEFSIGLQSIRSNRNVGYDALQYTPYDSLVVDEISNNKGINTERTLQIDYVLPVNKKLEFETGAKGILRHVSSDYDFNVYNFSTGIYNYDSIRSNTFAYDQNVAAIYLQASYKSKSNIGIKAGGRLEQTYVRGDFTTRDNLIFKKSYYNIIPSMVVSYTTKKRNSVKVSYTQRIQRPSMQFLNPYVNDTDPNNISYGNPRLGAELSHSFELGYNFFKGFSSINTSVYHRRTNNSIENIRFLNSQSVLVSTYDNIGRNTSTGASIGGNYMYQMKFMIGGNFNVYYYTVNSTSENFNLKNKGTNYNINFFSSYTFKNRWGMQAFGNFNGPKYTIQGKSTSFFFYSLGARREFRNKKGGVSFGLDNFASPFMHFKSEYTSNDFNSVSDNKILFFGARVSLDYRFGKMEFRNNEKKKRLKNDDLKQGEGDGLGGGMGGGK